MSQKQRPHVLIINEKHGVPEDALPFLGKYYGDVEAHKITSYRGLEQSLKEGINQFSLVIATASFVEYDLYANWKQILHQILRHPDAPPIIMVSKSQGFLDNLKGIDDRLHLVNTPEECAELVEQLLF